MARQHARATAECVPRRPSADLLLNSACIADRRSPIVELLPERQKEEALGGCDTSERADPIGQLKQLAAIGAHELDEDVVLACRDDHVARLVPFCDLVRDGLRRPRGADTDHRLRVEAELERVRNAGDLKDIFVAKSGVPRTDRRFGDSNRRGDAAEGLAPVLLQRLDDALIDPVEPPRRSVGAGIVIASQCEGILADPLALRQSRAVTSLRSSAEWGMLRTPIVQEEGAWHGTRCSALYSD